MRFRDEFKINGSRPFHEMHKSTWTEVDGKPSSFTPSAHSHDDKYFTEAEMNTKLAAKADINGTHLSLTSGFLKIRDIRGTAPTPDSFTDHTISAFFNDHSTYGGSWQSGITVKGWSNNYQVWQLSAGSTLSRNENLYFRTGIGTTWGSLREVFHTGHLPSWGEVAGKPTTFAPTSHTHDDRYFTESEINTKFAGTAIDSKALGTTNLNDVQTQGHYYQNANANTPNKNYPVNVAGHLTVVMGAGITQIYHAYNTSRSFTRSKYNSESFTPWRETMVDHQNQDFNLNGRLNLHHHSDDYNSIYGTVGGTTTAMVFEIGDDGGQDYWGWKFKTLAKEEWAMWLRKDPSFDYYNLYLKGALYAEVAGAPGYDIGHHQQYFAAMYALQFVTVSDRSLKNNINYISKNTQKTSREGKSSSKSEYKFFNFIKDEIDFADYYYNRVKPDEKFKSKHLATDAPDKVQPKTVKIESTEDDRFIGFIAQDVADNEIGKLMLVKKENGNYMYKLNCYTGILGLALQETAQKLEEEINKKDVEILSLTERVEKLEALIR